MTNDPTAPLTERTPEQVAAYLDDHLIMVLNAADVLYHGRRLDAEDHVRNRLVAIADTYPEPIALAAEEQRRRHERLVRVVASGLAEGGDPR